jgi:mannose/cellobiose epimerase-like protein (N-acyl-D-glucosamine 2-epimerase family)
MLPEHFDAEWNVERDFNIDNPADPFRPFGVTIGHLFEWSRLILQIDLTMPADTKGQSWVLDGARAMYEIGKTNGWGVDGGPGFVYTIDWQKKPVVTSRMQWVAAEAVMAAFTLWKVTGEDQYLDDYYGWWQYIQDHVIDKKFGSWYHELNAAQEVTTNTWSGKPDVYHAFNACILPLLPFKASFIGSTKAL